MSWEQIHGKFLGLVVIMSLGRPCNGVELTGHGISIDVAEWKDRVSMAKCICQVGSVEGDEYGDEVEFKQDAD